ncbi:HAD family hydrolase [Streptomyces radicis]|uniref:HAD family phosphatase n=1 Tax=Streptomyces radicis TaxID=1750517 RepID=A0A3A9W2V2_9ACTN|nr:HAD family hydrolase [Streptomyces radicis]RKN07240.1 HAD family phosphatase [Streptomyces radicis]RKN26742.1 HAD family phosphatase [Streptomyces radicis]
MTGLAQTFPYRLIATDLDGTLLRRDETISARTRDALIAAQAAGAEHIVATGRSVAWTRHILDDLGYRGLAVCGQGAQLYHAGEHRLLTSVTLDRALARSVVERLEAELGPLALAANRDGLDGNVAMDERFRSAVGSGFTGRADAPFPDHAPDRGELFAEPIIKMYLQRPGMSDDELAAAAAAVAGTAVGIVVSGLGLVEMLPLGLTKATGLSLAARRLGVTAAETIAFGDMPNDIAMLRWAAHGVAMAGAHPDVKAAADEVTADHDEDGIALVIERLLRPRSPGDGG